MKKIVFILVIAGFIANSFAIEKSSCEKETNVCCETTNYDNFAFNYPIDLGLAFPNKFYVNSEFLWMQSKEDCLEYATFNKDESSVDFDPPLVDGKIIGFDDFNDYKPGFRIAIGSFFTKDKWNVEAAWTYMRIKSDSEVSINKGFLISQFMTSSQSIRNNMKTASARWSGDYNTLDLSIGKHYHVSRYFVSKPFIGIRAAWICQDYHVRYFPESDSFGLIIPFKKLSVYFDNDFWGVGFRGFYEGDFLITSHWSIYGKAAFSLLFSQFNTFQRCDALPIQDGTKYEFESTFYRVQSNSEIGVGITYSKLFSKAKYLVSFKAGYELHQWWDQFNEARVFGIGSGSFLTPNMPLPNGDLSFNGFVFGLNVDF